MVNSFGVHFRGTPLFNLTDFTTIHNQNRKKWSPKLARLHMYGFTALCNTVTVNPIV